MLNALPRHWDVIYLHAPVEPQEGMQNWNYHITIYYGLSELRTSPSRIRIPGTTPNKSAVPSGTTCSIRVLKVTENEPQAVRTWRKILV